MNSAMATLKGEQLRQHLDQALSFEAGVDAPALESYIAACRVDVSLGDFVLAILNTTYWRDRTLPDPALKQACIGLAKEIDASVVGSTEPLYHSRRHFKEVCLALSLLLSAGTSQVGWPITDEEAWHLLLAAIGHDYGHEGRPNRSFGELEQKSCCLTGQFMRQAGMNILVIDRVENLILATEPTLYETLICSVSGGSVTTTLDFMKILLVEADLFASMLPEYGILLSKCLSKEFSVESPLAAQKIASPEGRLGFLKAHPYVSPNSRAINFGSVIELAVKNCR